MTPFKLTVRKALRPCLKQFNMSIPNIGYSYRSPLILSGSVVNTRRLYSSQNIRHLFTQLQGSKQHDSSEFMNANMDEGLEESADAAPKKWSKHNMPDKEVLAKQADESKKQQEEQNQRIAEASGKSTRDGRRRLKRHHRRRKLRPLKAVLTLTPNAVLHLKRLMNLPEPKMIRVSVKNRGCSGLTYHLEYVSSPEKSDEEVNQDGVKILVDSKALFSVIGSQMDWVDNKLESKFVFKNPNSKGSCGCGESFMV